MKNILFIEDENEIAELYKRGLTKAGFSVEVKADGKEGLQYALEKHPDLIILDLVMPKLDGMTVMQKLREEGEWGKNVLIVLFTNYDIARIKAERVIEGRPASYLLKAENTPEEFTAKITALLEKS